MVMKCKNEKMGYVMPQTIIYTLVGVSPKTQLQAYTFKRIIS